MLLSSIRDELGCMFYYPSRVEGRYGRSSAGLELGTAANYSGD
ncbi:unnamed protein product [Linum tenue]|uniref:Uncharacterized protein n=1 Tax=Linum tenue TaxID=586396 RepID=A0AAV0GVM2_9ROSI|nr:unnamed protein product [Linum tenue]